MGQYANELYAQNYSLQCENNALRRIVDEFKSGKRYTGQPVIGYSVAYDCNNSIPLFYEDYPGSIVDVTQLQIMLEKAEGYGYKHIGFILDRGYFSRENIRFMDKKKYSFFIRVKGM